MQSPLVSTLEVLDAGPHPLLNEYDTETNAGGHPKQAKALRSKGSPTRWPSTVTKKPSAASPVPDYRASCFSNQ
jgi:hypothetical protein